MKLVGLMTVLVARIEASVAAWRRDAEADGGTGCLPGGRRSVSPASSSDGSDDGGASDGGGYRADSPTCR